MEREAGYLYTNLTSAIADKHSPLRRYFDVRFPHVRGIQAAYRAAAGPLLVPGGTANPGILGAAFDFMIRLTLDSTCVPDVAIAAFRHHASCVAAITRVAHIGGAAACGCRDSVLPVETARASWALALCTEIYRAGPQPGSPLQSLYRRGRFTPAGLLDAAPKDAIAQLCALHTVAVEHLYPALPYSRMVLGPVFAGSVLCKADADLIADGHLIDVKTHLGALNRATGARSDRLPLSTIYQLAGYALFDYADTYGITAVGVYSARYGALWTRDFAEFLQELAGGVVDIAAERAAVWNRLGGR
ncbi:hypothetical protein BST13_31470 [Mycobacterium aquaticum]|uniref:Uncharacterized protein n=1 Tax=Mycobacterium aquaticum TaxID=1927124 RepID=A0A1X0AA51_9MYCO|nr:hypothetical protein BST13_31470 [Mycobacterium aquaticum]